MNPSTWWCSSCSRRRTIPTWWRSSRRSIGPPRTAPIVRALAEAAEAGKSVTALVELKARFDEEANIRWARDLERAGAQVVYGFIELKTHAKLSLVVRRESRLAHDLRPCRHRQLSPGDRAHLYRPVLLHRRSGDRRATSPASSISSPAMPSRPTSSGWRCRRSASRSASSTTSPPRSPMPRPGGPAAIWMKMNALVDPGIIDALYEASPGGRRDRADRARHLLPAAGRAGPLRKYPRQVDRRPLPRARPHLLLRRTATGCRIRRLPSTSRRPT